MPEHTFGGNWTQIKLDCLRKYLPAYTKIFERNERARYLTTIYVDAFAGTGYITPSKRKGRRLEQSGYGFLPDIIDPEAQEFLKGSAQIALDVVPAFDHYLFIERKSEYVNELRRLQILNHEIANKIRIIQGEANKELTEWCKQENWQKQRAVVFLDPYAMEVGWETLEVVAQTKAIDLWLLWPIGQAINRLLTKNQLPPETWSNALDRAFGTDAWRSRFYSQREPQLNMFGEEDTPSNIKSAGFREIEKFFIERLQTIFDFVAPNPLYLYNSQNTPLYLLCFASHNKAALNIAKDILGK